MLKTSLTADCGFSLILALLTTTLITSLLLMLHLQLATRWDLVNSVDAQLYSFTLAESGIEYGRALIPAVDLDSLLKGADGVQSGSGFPEWRNPIPLGKARTIAPGSWTPERDDEIPFQGENPGGSATPLPAGVTSSCVSPTTPKKIRVATRTRSSCCAPWVSRPFRFPPPCSLTSTTASP